MTVNQSETAFRKAIQVLPGGVDSPVRAMTGIRETPLFMTKGRGKTIQDLDGNRFTDYCLSWGALILGHCAGPVMKAVRKAVARGSSFGCPNILEHQFAEVIIEAFQSMEKIRFVNSGTEAVMSAVRLARGVTGKNKIIKFNGCYHGHADSFLVKAGSGIGHLSQSSSSGVPAAAVADTISLPFNDYDLLEMTIKKHHSETACVVLEPVPANMGVIPPLPDFLEKTRELTEKFGILLVFDEVITGFRVAYGGVQTLTAIKPDLTCLGKIIGGGFPVGAFGGRKDIMDRLAPTGDVYQAGTLSGNPVAMAAGLATLNELKKNPPYKRLEALVLKLKRECPSSLLIQSYGPMFSLFTAKRESYRNYGDVRDMDKGFFTKLYNELLSQGIYFSPSPFETHFLSVRHSEKDISKLVKALAGIQLQ